MSNETLEQAIESEIEETYSPEATIFTADDFEAITDELHFNDEIEWRLISDPPKFIAYKQIDGQKGFGFYLFETFDEISKEDLIDLIIKIENTYQLTQDKVKFDE